MRERIGGGWRDARANTGGGASKPTCC